MRVARRSRTSRVWSEGRQQRTMHQLVRRYQGLLGCGSGCCTAPPPKSPPGLLLLCLADCRRVFGDESLLPPLPFGAGLLERGAVLRLEPEDNRLMRAYVRVELMHARV